METKPIVDELINSINELHYDGWDEVWEKYIASLNVLNEGDVTVLLHKAIEKYERMRGTNYGGDARKILKNLIISLIDQGADVNGCIDGRFPINHAEAQNIIQLLLENGANPNAATADGYTPLMKVTGPKLVELLLDAGADPNAVSEGGHTPLRQADMWSDGSESTKLLIEAGANPEQKDPDGRTEIMDEYCSPVKLRKLLEAGANPNTRDKHGLTPLMFVTNPASVRALKKYGADFKAQDEEGRTVLMRALCISCQESKTIIALIKAGAPVNVADRNEDSVLKVDSFCKLGDDYFSRRVFAYDESDANFVDILLKAGALPDLPNKAGETPLMYWAGNVSNKDSRKVIALLLSSGADINRADNKGLHCLMHAVKNNNQRCIKLLLQKKADPNKVSKNGRTCLGWAFSGGRIPTHEMIDVLLDRGALINGDPGQPKSKHNLLGKFLLAEDFTYSVGLLKRGAVLNRSTLSTMGITPECIVRELRDSGNDFDATGSIGKLVAFSRIHPKLFKGAIDEDDVEIGSVLGGLVKHSAVEGDQCRDPFRRLEPGNWPPYFPERTRVLVEGVKGKKLKPRLCFVADEYEDYYDESYVYKYREKKSDQEIAEEIKQKVKNNREITFKSLLQASDQTVAILWNDEIAKNSKSMWLAGYYSRFEKSISAPEYKFMLARCGAAVLPGLLHLAKSKTNIICRLLLPVSDTRIALLMANKLFGSHISSIARKWFIRHTEAAIHGLVPLAVGPFTKNRDNCETALRYMAYKGLGQEIKSISVSYGEEVEHSVEEILSVDHRSDYHQRALANLPERLFGDEIKRPTIEQSNNKLSERYLPALYGMMSISTYDDVYPGLAEILELLEPNSLAEFAWSVFLAWENLPSSSYKHEVLKAKKEGKWMYHCLAYMGNDHTVKSLVSYINSWPRSGGMSYAVTGLDILANMGTDVAIRSTNSILLKTKYKPLLARASDILETVADVRGLTKAQLDDRLVPTLGLDDAGEMALDFGPRAFTVTIDEKLRPKLLDPEGRPLKVLPRAAKADTKVKVRDATAQWKTLKADLRVEASTQLFRFEQAMINSRQWTGPDFKSLLVEHPLLQHLVKHLVWAEYQGGKLTNTFRVGKDGEFLTNKDKPIGLDDSAHIGIPHPLQIKGQLKNWIECLARHKLKQPFAQVGRQYFIRKDDENKDLYGIDGARAPTKVFRGMKAKGWKQDIGDAGSIWGFSKEFSGGTVSLGVDGVIAMFDDGMDDEEQIVSVSLPKKLMPVEYSELVRDLKELMH